MATDTSHRVIMGKMVLPLFSRLFLIRFFFILAGSEDMHENSASLDHRRRR